MSLLAILIAIKIIGSIFIVTIPFLLGTKHKLESALSLSGDSLGFFRLYGWAVTSLLISYGYGFMDEINGVFPYGAVVTGIFSNLGAAFILIRHAKSSTINTALTLFFGGIGVLLCIALGAEVYA